MIKAREDNKDKELLNQFLYSNILETEVLKSMLNVFCFTPENMDEEINGAFLYTTKPPKNCYTEFYDHGLLNKKMKRQDPMQVKEDSNNSSSSKDKIKKAYFITKTKTSDKIDKSNLEDTSSIQKISKDIYKLEYYIKAFKVNCFQYLTKELNRLHESFNKNKFFRPNHQEFTSKAKEIDNLYFFLMTLEEAFTYVGPDKNVNEDKKRKKNKSLIEKIKKSPGNDELKSLLKMTVEESIGLYYKSQSFEEFRENEKIKFFDSEFQKEKKFSMLEKNGFIKLIKLYHNDTFSNSFSSIQIVLDETNSI